MEEQGIPFYRFNPQLDEVIPSGETDLVKLLNMLIKVGTTYNGGFKLNGEYLLAGQDLCSESRRARISHVGRTCAVVLLSS